MSSWLISLLGRIYTQLPASIRPRAKRAFYWGLVRAQGLWERRTVERGQRVEFLGFEIAHLESYEFLGPGPHEVLVRADSSVVSPGTERAVLCGLPGARRPFPYAPGYSVAGTVIRTGKGVRDVVVGDRVAGRMSHASVGVMAPGSLFKIPDAVASEEASFLELGIICLQGIRKASIRPGDRVAVLGQGLIGQLATRLARVAGADPIVAIASTRRRMASAVGPAGADRFLALAEDPDELHRVQADIVIEAVGSMAGIIQAMAAARHGGTVVLLGSSRDLGRNLDWWSLAQKRQLRLVGAHISALPARDPSPGQWTYGQEAELWLRLLQARRISVDDLVTWRAAPEDCNRVFEVLAEGGREQVCIVFDWRRQGNG